MGGNKTWGRYMEEPLGYLSRDAKRNIFFLAMWLHGEDGMDGLVKT